MIRSIDVPQANALETVRQVVYAVDLGVRRLEALADFTGYSLRHTGYRLQAARILGLVRLDGEEAHITALGERLLCTDPQTERERAVFYDAIAGSAVIQILVPDLLSLMPPDTESIAERLFMETKLGHSTAARRAGGLLAWRRYVFGDAPAERRVRSQRSAPPAPIEEPKQLSLF